MRPIDADKLTKKLDELYAEVEGIDFSGVEGFHLFQDGIVDAQYAVDEMPTIDAEQVKHGHWIGVEYDDNDLCFVSKCSECGEVFEKTEDGNWNYCPNCGAKMERRKE